VLFEGSFPSAADTGVAAFSLQVEIGVETIGE
jgi:hypothetical protein